MPYLHMMSRTKVPTQLLHTQIFLPGFTQLWNNKRGMSWFLSFTHKMAVEILRFCCCFKQWGYIIFTFSALRISPSFTGRWEGNLPYNNKWPSLPESVFWDLPWESQAWVLHKRCNWKKKREKEKKLKKEWKERRKEGRNSRSIRSDL